MALDLLEQAGLALCYYGGLVLIMRLAGKRLAGQTTTFDLLVLIAMGVVLQSTVLREGTTNAVVFIATVLAAHITLARLCQRSRRIRRVIRGAPRPLIWNGRVSYDALEEEGLSYDELLAGLRKLGHASPRAVRLATLEETGHISAVAAASNGGGNGAAAGDGASGGSAADDDRHGDDEEEADEERDAYPSPEAVERARPRPQQGHVRQLGDV